MQVQQVLASLRQQARVLRQAHEEVEKAIVLLAKHVDVVAAPIQRKKRKKMSKEARERIGEAARARWAKKKEGK